MPLSRNVSPSDVAMPTGPAHGRRPVGLVTIEPTRLPRPSRISPNQRIVSLPADADAPRQGPAGVLAQEHELEARRRRRLDARARRLPASSSAGGAQRDRDVLGGAVGVRGRRASRSRRRAPAGRRWATRRRSCRRSRTASPSTLTIASPPTRPAAAAGEPGLDARRTAGRRTASRTRRSPVKIASASSRFMTTPATQDHELAREPRLAERARVEAVARRPRPRA